MNFSVSTVICLNLKSGFRKNRSSSDQMGGKIRIAAVWHLKDSDVANIRIVISEDEYDVRILDRRDITVNITGDRDITTIIRKCLAVEVSRNAMKEKKPPRHHEPVRPKKPIKEARHGRGQQRKEEGKCEEIDVNLIASRRESTMLPVVSAYQPLFSQLKAMDQYSGWKDEASMFNNRDLLISNLQSYGSFIIRGDNFDDDSSPKKFFTVFFYPAKGGLRSKEYFIDTSKNALYTKGSVRKLESSQGIAELICLDLVRCCQDLVDKDHGYFFPKKPIKTREEMRTAARKPAPARSGRTAVDPGLDKKPVRRPRPLSPNERSPEEQAFYMENRRRREERMRTAVSGRSAVVSAEGAGITLSELANKRISALKHLEQYRIFNNKEQAFFDGLQEGTTLQGELKRYGWLERIEPNPYVIQIKKLDDQGKTYFNVFYLKDDNSPGKSELYISRQGDVHCAKSDKRIGYRDDHIFTILREHLKERRKITDEKTASKTSAKRVRAIPPFRLESEGLVHHRSPSLFSGGDATRAVRSPSEGVASRRTPTGTRSPSGGGFWSRLMGRDAAPSGRGEEAAKPWWNLGFGRRAQ